MLASLLLGLQLSAASAAPLPAATAAHAAAPPTAAQVDALFSKDEAAWREAALQLSFAGPAGARAVAARKPRPEVSHRAVQTYLMLALLESVTPADLKELPALKNFWEPAVAETRQLMQRPILMRRPGPKAQPPERTENETSDKQEAARNGRAVRRMQGFLVPIFLDRMAGTDATVTLEAVLAMERTQAWSAHAVVERIAADPARAGQEALVKAAARYLDLWRKAETAPFPARLEPRLAAMVAFEEVGEADVLWKGLRQAAPTAFEARTSEEFWARARPAFAAFWKAAARPQEERAAALSRWSDQCRGYAQSHTAGEKPLRLELVGPAGSTATVLDAGGKALVQGPLPLSMDGAPPAGLRVVAQCAGRKVELSPEGKPTGILRVELLPPFGIGIGK